MSKENQYSLVAREAYLNIVHKRIPFEKAWKEAAENIIASDSSRKKVCPKATFIGLCESGLLKNISALSHERGLMQHECAKH